MAANSPLLLSVLHENKNLNFFINFLDPRIYHPKVVYKLGTFEPVCPRTNANYSVCVTLSRTSRFGISRPIFNFITFDQSKKCTTQ